MDISAADGAGLRTVIGESSAGDTVSISCISNPLKQWWKHHNYYVLNICSVFYPTEGCYSKHHSEKNKKRVKIKFEENSVSPYLFEVALLSYFMENSLLPFYLKSPCYQILRKIPCHPFIQSRPLIREIRVCYKGPFYEHRPFKQYL